MFLASSLVPDCPEFTRQILRELFDTVHTHLTGGQTARSVGNLGMTNQQKRPQALEDRKVQKLVERINQKQALQAKAAQEQSPASPSRS